MSPSASGAATNSRCEDRPNKGFKPNVPPFTDPKALVTFVVGPEGHTTEFLIHKEVACHHSKVLEAAFRSQFVEGSTQTYRLADTTEGAFKFMMQWMYSQKFNLLHHDPNHKVDIKWDGKDCNQDNNLNAAIDAMEEIFKCTNELLPVGTYHYIYQNTSTDSYLRKYTFRRLLNGINKRSFRNIAGRCPRDMLVDLAAHLLTETGSFGIEDIFVKDFHVDDELS